MITAWKRDLTPTEAEEIKREYEASGVLRARLKKMLEDKIEAARTSSRKSTSYDSPSWALLQADVIGYERALFEIIKTISE